MSDLVKASEQTIALSQDTIAAALAHPFWVLPESVRAAAFSFWVVKQFAFKTPLDLTGPIAMDIAKGLRPEDAVAILDDMSSPENRAKIKAMWDFEPEWSRRSSLAIKASRQRESAIEASKLTVEEESQRANYRDLVDKLAERMTP